MIPGGTSEATETENAAANVEVSPKAEPEPKAPIQMDDAPNNKTPSGKSTISDIRDSAPSPMETKYEDLFLLVRAQNRLDEPTQVEELNDEAREKEAACKKQREKVAQKQHVEELKNQAQSLPSLKTPNVVPRIDKINDRLEERSQKGSATISAAPITPDYLLLQPKVSRTRSKVSRGSRGHQRKNAWFCSRKRQRANQAWRATPNTTNSIRRRRSWRKSTKSAPRPLRTRWSSPAPRRPNRKS